jgi:hypothetical protein
MIGNTHITGWNDANGMVCHSRAAEESLGKLVF